MFLLSIPLHFLFARARPITSERNMLRIKVSTVTAERQLDEGVTNSTRR